MIVLICGGGHCVASIDVIEKENKYAIAGIVDTRQKIGKKVLGYRIMASDDELPSLARKYKYFLITSAPIKTLDKKRMLFNEIKRHGVRLPVIISPYAYVSRRAEIGEGTMIMHGAYVNAGARIGANCIINTGALVEHDCVIGDHCNISTLAVVNGECRVGDQTFVGSGSVIINGITIAGKTIIGAGSVVIRPIAKEGGVYAGNPAREIG